MTNETIAITKAELKKQLLREDGFMGYRVRDWGNNSFRPEQKGPYCWKLIFKIGAWKKYAVSRGHRSYEEKLVEYKTPGAAANYCIKKLEGMRLVKVVG